MLYVKKIAGCFVSMIIHKEYEAIALNVLSLMKIFVLK